MSQDDRLAEPHASEGDPSADLPARGGPGPRNAIDVDVPLKPFVSQWLNDHEHHFAPSTERAYEHAMAQFETFRVRKGCPPLTRGLIRQYIRDLKAARKSAAYLQRQLSVLRSFGAWAVEQEYLAQDPARSVPLPKLSTEYRREALTADEAARLVGELRDVTATQMRDRLLVSLVLRTGVRLIELHRANVEDYVPKGSAGGLFYIQGKGRVATDSFVVIVPLVAKLFDRCLGLRGLTVPAAPLFVSAKPGSHGRRLSVRGIQAILTKYLERAGLKRKRLTAYSLRHTAATLALENGATVQEVQAMLRHASISTTQRYVHAARRITDGAEHAVRIPGDGEDST